MVTLRTRQKSVCFGLPVKVDDNNETLTGLTAVSWLSPISCMPQCSLDWIQIRESIYWRDAEQWLA